MDTTDLPPDPEPEQEPESERLSIDQSKCRVTPAKKAYPQKFRKKWLTDPQLRDWLIEVPKRNGESGAECKVCKTYLNIKICDLKNHALTKKHIKNMENLGGPKHQLLLKVEANALTEVDGFHHSEGGIGTPPSGFVIQQSSITPRELPSNQSVKPYFPNHLIASEDYNFEDLIKFDSNGDPDTSTSKSKNTWPFLEEKYFVYTGEIDKNIITFDCKLCSPLKTVRVSRHSLYNLKYHIRTNHWSYYDVFMRCIEANVKPGRKKKLFSNPWPYLEEKYFKVTGAIDNKKVSVDCKLCLPVKTLKANRHSLYCLKQHIRIRHPTYWNEFQSFIKVNAKPGRRKKSYIKLHYDENTAIELCNQSVTPPENQQSTIFIDSELPKTRCKKIDLPAGLSDTDDEGLYDDDIADPDFSPHDPPDSPEMMNNITTNRKSPDLMNELPANRKYVRPAFVHYSKGSDLSRFVPLFDRVLVQKEEAFSQILLKDGVLIAPKMNTARVVAVGTGIRSDSGEMIPLEVSVGDEVMIPEYGGTKVELDGKEYILYCDSDLLAKFRSK